MEGDVLPRSLWPWAAGRGAGGPGCQPPRGWALGRDPRGLPADPVRGLKPGDTLLEGFQTLFSGGGCVSISKVSTSQKAVEEEGGPPISRPQNGGGQESLHGCPGPWRGYHGRR